MTTPAGPEARTVPARLPKLRPSPRVRVTVTEEHIATAVPRDSGHCMIADAVREAVPEAQNVTVDLATIRWTDRERGLRYAYLTPTEAQRALLMFDKEIVPPGFSFGLRNAHVTRAQTLAIRSNQKPKAQKPKAQKPEPRTEVLGPSYLVREESTSIPVRRGGKLPPIGVLAYGHGNRRVFGLRAAGSPVLPSSPALPGKGE